MAEAEPLSGGLFGSLRRLFQTILTAVQTRVELFGVELQEEKVRLVELLVWAAAAVFLAAMAVIVATFTVVWLCGDAARPYVLIGFIVLYGGGAAGAALTLHRRLKDRPPPFAETVAELRKDISWVKSQK